MSSLGAYLRELRERRGVSLEELARATRVNVHYLEALERDDLAALPAPVFVRGFVRAYCQYLGEPPDEALARCPAPAGAAPVAGRAPVAARRRSAATGASGTVLVSFVLLVILGAALFAVTLALQPARQAPVQAARQVGPAPPGLSSAGAPGPGAPGPGAPAGPAPAPSGPGASTPAPPPAPPPAPAPGVASGGAAPTAVARPAPPGGPPPAALPLAAVTRGVDAPYRLVARTTEATWIRVRTEDGRSTEETIPPGQVREWVSNGPFVLTVGNAGGVTLELNGRVLPPLGARGAVIPRLVLPPPQ